MKRSVRNAIIAMFLIGAAVRLVDVYRPIDRASWRESDVGAIARNFATESMDITKPRIDWRGTSLGFVEMEFPLYPFLIAVTYKLFGVNDVFGRFWSLLFSFASLVIFYRLAREYLDGSALAGAVAFFAFNPLIVEFSTSVQPEGLMILFYVGSALFFLRWIEHGSDRDLVLAAVFTALALLAKLPAAHIGLLYALLLLRKFGLRAATRWRVWLFGATSLVPAAIWYVHAKELWKTYGNSLGVSNEYHWIGLDFFTNPYFVKGILNSELVYVWSVAGVAVGALAIARAWRGRTVSAALIWLAACFLFYVVAARTAADEWASYYHIFSVVPAAILFGAGIRELIGFARSWADRFSAHSGVSNLLRAGFIVAMFAAASFVFLIDARIIRARILENRVADESFSCAREIKPKLGPGAILVSGDACFDRDGYEVAYNASFMFYWLERKGFNICVEHQSLKRVENFAFAGARYFVAQRSKMDMQPGFEKALRERYSVVTECKTFVVFDIEVQSISK